MELIFEWEGGPEIVAKAHQIEADIGMVAGIMEELADMLYPEIVAASQTVWNVRTGFYMGSWYRHLYATDELAEVVIGNTAPYAGALEFGWTTRAGTFRPSPGVAIPTLTAMLPALVDRFDAWMSQLVSK